MIASPVRYLADTPNMHSAMQRVENQFKLDGFNIERTQLRGGGRFMIETDSEIFIYQWSANGGTEIHINY